MDSIKDIIPTVIGKISKQTPDTGKDINATWASITGNGGSKIVGLKNGMLSIHVDTAMRMVNLNARRESILEDMQKSFPEIKNIYLKVGKI